MSITSPCTGVCKINSNTGWCLGCGRSRDEMDGWGMRTEAWRQKVWKKIPQRLHQMGVICRRLPWTKEDIREFVISSLEDVKGTWVFGVVGAVGEFTAAPCERVSLIYEDDVILAHTKNGAMQIKINDEVRALTFEQSDPTIASLILLVVKKKSGNIPTANVITDLGKDVKPLFKSDNQRLFDLGLGRKEARFSVRVASGSASKALKNTLGQNFKKAFPFIAEALIQESPTRVIDTAIGRIEVQGKIPPPEASSPLGPHTHLLPNELETGRPLPIGMEIPSSYLPGAIFYPAK